MAADDVTISLGFPGFIVTPQRVEPERYDIWVEPTATGAVCPRGGQPSVAYHDGDERTVRDLPILGRPVYLHMLQRRFTCASCGHPFNEASDVVDWQQRHTRRYQHYLTYQCYGSSIQEVSRKQHIGYRVVERWLYRQARNQWDTGTRRLPTWVGIDEFAKRKGHQYATIGVNLDTHRVFDVLDKRTKATVAAFLAARSDKRRLKVAPMDRRRECRDAVEAQCPWTWIVIDRFPVIKQANAALHQVRQRLMSQADETDDQRRKDIAPCLVQLRRH